MQRRRMVLGSMVAAFVVVALLAVFAFELADTQAKSREDVEARVHERGTLATALIDSLFETSRQQAPVYTKTYGGRTVSTRALEANVRQNTYLAVLDASGRVLASTRGLDARARDGLRRSAAIPLARAGRSYGLGNVLPYGKTGVVNLAVPFPTPFGRRILVTGFPPSSLDAIFGGELRKIPGVEGSQSYLIDGGNTVISSTNPKRKPGYVFTTPQQVAALAKPSGRVNGRYYDQAALRNSGWRIALSAPEDKLFATVSGLRKWTPWLIFAAFALVTFVAFALARRTLHAADQVRTTNARLAEVNAELAQSNAALNRRAAELARSNDELEQFASIASHDLQEPLRKVRTFTQQLTVMEAERLSDKGQDYLGRTNAAAERMQRLIEDLLRFSRVATHGRPFAPVDLEQVTREVLEDLEVEVARHGATVQLGALPTINGDAAQMRQLMQNLVSNALKFRREGVAPEVAIGAELAGETATITVADNGIGFEPRYEQRIFRVFERLHGRGTYPGTGIGLALCRKIAERHGGTIAAEGRPGIGSTFSVALPVDQREEVITVAPPREAAPPEREQEPAHV